MNIGFIGAGKVGSSFGHYLKDQGINVIGYASRTRESAIDAAKFTGTRYFNVDELVETCDYIFITTPDDIISNVWNQIKEFNLQDKKIVHMSGSRSSNIFEDIESHGAFGYSLHPLLPITDRYSYKHLDNAVFTIEGKNIANIEGFLSMSKIHFFQILEENKAKYHAAAVFASNYVVALAKISKTLLVECGIPENDTDRAIYSLMEGTICNIKEKGVEKALTGPYIRGDIGTVEKHIAVFLENKKVVNMTSKTANRKVNEIADFQNIYKELGKVALGIAKERESLSQEKAIEILNILGGEMNEKNSCNI
jgi:predicted short-subunit dehydrogenase-like oxidoreductase (DUF2520 family)